MLSPIIYVNTVNPQCVLYVGVDTLELYESYYRTYNSKYKK